MSAVKMGLTIEEAAECNGYRQEHHAEAGGMGKAARPQSGAQDHYPQGHAGTVSDGQSGKKSLKPDDVRRVE